MTLLTIGAALFDSAGPALELARAGVRDGQVWRFFSGHLVHYSADHLFYSLGAFLLLAITIETIDRATLLIGLVCSSVATGFAFWFLTPELSAYRGLSGIDSCLFVALVASGVIQGWREREPWRALIFLAVLAGFSAKITYEVLSGRGAFVDTADAGMTPVPMAHVAGGLIGLALAPRLVKPKAPARRAVAPETVAFALLRSTRKLATNWVA